MRRALLAMLCLCALVFASGQTLNKTSAPIDVSTAPPIDTTYPWMDIATGDVFTYHDTLNLWLGPSMDWDFTRASQVAFVGAMKFLHGQDSDTTRSAPDGMWYPESLLIRSVEWFSGHSHPVAADGSLQVWTVLTNNAPAEKWIDEVGAKHNSWDSMEIYYPASHYMCVFTKANDTTPVDLNNPQAIFHMHRFRRPTT